MISKMTAQFSLCILAPKSSNVNVIFARIWNLTGENKLTKETLRLSFMVFENHLKCLIGIFQFCHFPPFFVLLKLTGLVTLFDRKL